MKAFYFYFLTDETLVKFQRYIYVILLWPLRTAEFLKLSDWGYVIWDIFSLDLAPMRRYHGALISSLSHGVFMLTAQLINIYIHAVIYMRCSSSSHCTTWRTSAAINLPPSHRQADQKVWKRSLEHAWIPCPRANPAARAPVQPKKSRARVSAECPRGGGAFYGLFVFVYLLAPTGGPFWRADYKTSWQSNALHTAQENDFGSLQRCWTDYDEAKDTNQIQFVAFCVCIAQWVRLSS